MMERVGQMLLWQELAQEKKVVHVGMRSGNLETFAMLGMDVVYLENRGNPSGERMLAFRDGDIPYERKVIERSPTKTGQIDLDGQAPVMVKVEERLRKNNYKRPVKEFLRETNSSLTEEQKYKGVGPDAFYMSHPKEVSMPGQGDKKAIVPEPLRRKFWEPIINEAKGKTESRGFSDDDLRSITDLVEQKLNSREESSRQA